MVVSMEDRRRSLDLLRREGCDRERCIVPRGVKVIPKGFFKSKVIGLGLPYGLRSIEDRVFENDDLGMLTLPDGLESIGFRAFFNAGTIRVLNIPDSVRYIGPQAFVLSRLQRIDVGAGNSYFTSLRGVLFDKDRKTLIKFPPMMEEDVYYVPDTVETIADYAF
jgi:lactocepin